MSTLLKSTANFCMEEKKETSNKLHWPVFIFPAGEANSLHVKGKKEKKDFAWHKPDRAF